MTLVGDEVYPLAMKLNPSLAQLGQVKNRTIITQLVFRLGKLVITDVDTLNNILYIHSSLQLFPIQIENLLNSFITSTSFDFQIPTRRTDKQTDTK